MADDKNRDQQQPGNKNPNQGGQRQAGNPGQDDRNRQQQQSGQNPDQRRDQPGQTDQNRK